jgi:hypothetical protein
VATLDLKVDAVHRVEPSEIAAHALRDDAAILAVPLAHLRSLLGSPARCAPIRDTQAPRRQNAGGDLPARLSGSAGYLCWKALAYRSIRESRPNRCEQLMRLKHRDGGLGEVTTIARDNGAHPGGVCRFVCDGVLEVAETVVVKRTLKYVTANGRDIEHGKQRTNLVMCAAPRRALPVRRNRLVARRHLGDGVGAVQVRYVFASASTGF